LTAGRLPEEEFLERLLLFFDFFFCAGALGWPVVLIAEESRIRLYAWGE